MNFPKLQRIHNPQYISFAPRLVADLIDSLILAIWFPLTLWYLAGSSVNSIVIDGLTALALIVLPGSLLALLIKVYLIHHSGQTFGKMIVGIEVLNDKKETLTWKRAFFRETLGKALSSYVLCAGQLSVLFDPKHQAWHDHVVGSFVYPKNKNVVLGVGVLIALIIGYGFAFSMSSQKFQSKFLPEIQTMRKLYTVTPPTSSPIKFIPQKSVPYMQPGY